ATGTFFRKVDGAVGTTIPFLGSLTGIINLAVYAGAKNGVVGRVQLTLGSNQIPGVVFNGQFLLEINTFTQSQTIQTFGVQTRTLNNHTVFAGFKRNAAGNLVVENTTITTVAGFRLEMGGLLIIADRFQIEAHVMFMIEVAGAEQVLVLVVPGSLPIAQ